MHLLAILNSRRVLIIKQWSRVFITVISNTITMIAIAIFRILLVTIFPH